MFHSARDRIVRTIRGLILGCAAVALNGCLDAMGPGGFDFSGCFVLCGQVDYTLSPDGAHILLGDTTTFYTWSCASGEYCDGSRGTVASRWSITGGAATSERFDGQRSLTNASAVQILVRGIAAGQSDINAVANNDSTRSKTVRVVVADSSVITAIDLASTFYRPDTVSVGNLLGVTAKLRDSQGTQYSGRPTEWSVSDTTVLGLRQDGVSNGVSAKYVRGKKAGTVDLTARFLDVSSTIRITVVP